MINDLIKLKFNRNEAKILEFFISNINKEFTAREVSKSLRVSLPRTYTLLNKLCYLGFLNRRVDKNIKFSISDAETSFRNYFNKKYEEINILENNLCNVIIPKYKIKKPDIILLSSNEEVYRAIYQIALNSDNIKIFSKTPLLLLPDERKIFWKKKLFELLKQKIESGIDIFYLIDLRNVRKNINSNNIKDVKKSFQWLKTHPNFHLKDTEGRDMASMVITDNEVVILFHYIPLETGAHSGIILRQKEILKFFSSAYNEIFFKAKEINNII